MMRLSPGARKSAAVALLLAALALPLLVLYAIFANFDANQVEIADKRDQLAKLEAIARYASRLDTRAPDPAEAAFVGWFLPDTDAAIAAANLQARLKAMAQSHVVDVTQASNVKPRTIAGVNYVGVSLEMMGRAEGIHGTLQDIENAIPLLVVEKSNLRADPAGGDPRYDPVRINLGIEIWAALPAPLAGDAGKTP
jgi:hypothetical protein